MNIKDIAKLSGVSPTTVSKIINRKDDNISPATRERVLEIVNRYQYTPFSEVLRRSAAHSRLIGAIVPNNVDSYYANIIRHLDKNLISQGYNLIICNTDGDPEAETVAYNLLCARMVECIVFMGEFQSPALSEKIVSSGIPYVILDPNNNIQNSIKIHFNDQKSMALLIEHFFTKNHEKIALVVDKKDQHLIRYYRQQMERRKQVYDASMVFETVFSSQETEGILDIIIKTGTKAIVAGNLRIARELYKYASLKHLAVGRDFSLAAFDDQNYGESLTPDLTCIKFPFERYGRKISQIVLGLIEGKAVPGEIHTVSGLFHAGDSVSENIQDNQKKIVVVGTINMDVMLEVEYLPKSGETVIIRNKTILPGGKGANQAIGAAYLGGKVSLIGRLGNDMYGKKLYHNLHAANVNVRGVVFDNSSDTGRAYIYMTDQAEYSIGVHAGANERLDKRQIDQFLDKILQAEYCLVQTEIPLEVIEYLDEICGANGIRMILKPSPAIKLPDNLLKGLYMLVPNETELHRMVPENLSIEEKVDVLLRRGVSNIILTLGENGCYYSDGNSGIYFKAAEVNVVDTTGASDAFISALAVYLCNGENISQAIEYANIAAGISITRVGVQSALADRKAVEMMYRNYPSQLHP